MIFSTGFGGAEELTSEEGSWGGGGYVPYVGGGTTGAAGTTMGAGATGAAGTTIGVGATGAVGTTTGVETTGGIAMDETP